MTFRLIKKQGAYFVELPTEFVKTQDYEAGDTLIASSETGFKVMKRPRVNAEQRAMIDRLIDQYRGTLALLAKV
jgi:hypothetical protein